MSHTPLVSIVTPSFNAERFIERTIESVQKQDYQNIEHIIVDGGSTDGTIQILEKYPHLFWTSESDRGQSHALNKGFDSAKGEIIGWLNADDVYQPGALKRAISFLQENPNIDFVYSDCIELDENDSFVRLIQGHPIKDTNDIIFRQPIPQPTIFFRRKVLDVLKGVNEELHYVMDWEFWLRASLSFRFKYLMGEPLAGFRKYQGSKSHSWPRKFNEEWIKVLSQFLKNPQGVSVALIQKGIRYQRALLHVASVFELVAQKKRNSAFAQWLDAIKEFPSLRMWKTFLYLFFVILKKGDQRIVPSNRKINILYVQAGKGIGGAKISLSHLVKALAPEKLNVHLTVSEPVDDLFWRMIGEEITSIKTFYLPFWFRSSNPFMAFLSKVRHGWYLLSTLHLVNFIWKNDIDLVHSNSSASPVGAFAAFLTRRPHVWHVREPIGVGTEFHFTFGDLITALLMKMLSSEIICISEYTALFFNRNKISPKVILNGIDLKEFENAHERGEILKKKLGLENKLVIGMVGSLRANWKEHDVFLRAVALIKNEIPEACFLVFGGTSDLNITEYTRSLKALMNSLGLANQVVWANHVEDIPAMMNTFDLLIHPVSKEGSGRVVMEAMAAGKPVVAVRAGGVVELIQQDQTGILVEAKNPSELADAVIKLIQNPKAMKKMGMQSKKYAYEHFSHERTACAIFKIYQQVLKK